MATQLDQMERDFTNIKDQMTLLRGMLDQKQQVIILAGNFFLIFFSNFFSIFTGLNNRNSK